MKKLTILLAFISVLSIIGCSSTRSISSASGVELQSVKIETDSDGRSIEQRNIMERLKRDNNSGSIKFLYLVSPFTGEIILQSSVKGKVTSSSKRLTPEDLRLYNNSSISGGEVNIVEINGKTYTSNQLPGDDGTYGSSMPYLFWFDQNGTYHQTYVGAAIVHITDQPVNFRQTTQTIETQ